MPRFFRPFFEDLFEDVWEPLERIRIEFPKAERIFSPTCDVYEKGENVVIRCQIPGVKPEEVDIEVREDSVVIKGERKEEKEIKKENYYHKESAYGSFYRTLPLPVTVKSDKAQAEFEDGILKITIPKIAPAKKVKVVKVKAKKK
jgi:HSP20 family protein